jgi:propionyl-CoA carboxylase alpha chain
MRVCHNVDDLVAAWEMTKSEALKFFSDDRLLLEQYIATSHHIEFQILADAHGNVAVFPERECSIQRRNQKIIEESPSVLLSDETRHRMADQCRALCRAVQYESAGTVEFLVDDHDPTRFYFLEMNTRLQVEHPVTEIITGVDFVEGMLRVGAGEVVPFPSDGIVPHCGHGIECRIYAEDPTRNFLPSTGPLTLYQEPPPSSNIVRVDSGVAHGQNITSFFDPMLSKVIARGDNRNEAIDQMVNALDQYVIDGVRHNIRLIQSVLRQPAFIAGDTPTSFLPRHYPDGFTKVILTDHETHELVVAAALILRHREDSWDDDTATAGEEMIVRLGGQFGEAFGVTFHQEAGSTTTTSTTTTVQRMDKSSAPLTLQSAGLVLPPQPKEGSSPLVVVATNGVQRFVQVLRSCSKTGEVVLQMFGHDTTVIWQSAREYELTNWYMQRPVPRDTSNIVPSPMPGLLIRYAVNVGDSVVEGQELCIIESMKMQNMIRSPRAGMIAACNAAVGDSLRVDQVLMTFQPKNG